MASQENLNQLAALIQDSQNPDPNVRKPAEVNLQSASRDPGFSILLLQSLQVPNWPEHIKQGSAVQFKNVVKYQWDSVPEGPATQIKENIVNLMLSTSNNNIQKQLSAALALISEKDFPDNWKNLLPDLVARLQSNDFNVLVKVLSTIESILKRYHDAMKTEEVLLELQYILAIIQEPLLRLYTGAMSNIEPNVNNAAVLFPTLKAIKLMTKIFHHLNAVDLPEYFEDHMQEWMTHFHNLLIFNSTLPQIIGEEDGDKAGILHQVQSHVCNVINLYTIKYEEEFNTYFMTFLKDIWSLLERINLETRYDSLVVSAIRFLSALSSGVQHVQFRESGILQTICQRIVIPNLTLREVELENFEDNPIEYIRRDIEGGTESDSRRNAATNLIKSLRKYFEGETTTICSSYINELLAKYESNPKANWSSKDVSIYLITALAVRSTVASQGATNINNLVPVMCVVHSSSIVTQSRDFFGSQILPELQKESPAHLILKADALKFVWTFRQQLNKEVYLSLMPLIVSNLRSKNYVVHTYAAACLERLLSVKDRQENGVYVPRLGKEELAHFLPSLLDALFVALESDNAKENEFLIKAVMRVFSTSQEAILPYAGRAITALVNVFSRIYRNPVNATFNHYLFESLAVVIKSVVKSSPESRRQLEETLFGIFRAILEEDIIEFAPYMFQILSLLIETSTTELSPPYFTLIQSILQPLLWSRTSNIRPLVRLLAGYVQKGGAQIVSSGYLVQILGVIQRTLLNIKNDEQGFFLLTAIVCYLPPDAFAPYLKDMLGSVFSYLTNNKTQKGRLAFLLFSSRIILKYSATFYMQQLEAVQAGLTMNALEKIWVAFLRNASGTLDKKILSVATSKLLVEPSILQLDHLWKSLLETDMALLELESTAEEEDDQDAEEAPELGGAHYTPLSFGVRAEEDPIPEIEPKRFLAVTLSQIAQQRPDKLALVASLPDNARNLLTSYCEASGIPLRF
ncbi:hypothetical protein PROFUN_07528 [Planoprotostelium fungivorum]|uniref:Importin N-terminal domain-containing protein n=1 Tax=Planoprotostelium fungivorum TaxID=1890364 RepID=A0A2P6NLN8_9EUKA|nr:hypothetical protein PROFUN_07528 [Planoprotostelium fungivorum]